jgi:hypothetical protein
MLFFLEIYSQIFLEAEYKMQKMTMQMVSHFKVVTALPSRHSLFWILKKLVWV